MNHKVIEIKKGIKLHIINTEKFKTNLLSVFLTTTLNKENVTKNALIPAVLRRGSINMPTQEAISKELEEMYGASFNCGIEKTGDNQVIKFYLEAISDDFLPQKEDLLKKSIEKLIEIAFKPLVENDSFKEEYIKSEKENLKQIIEGKKDNKAQYAMDRCVEIMYKDKPYGLYKYGDIESLEKIQSHDLYEYYLDLISKCKIDIFISGQVDESIKDEISKQLEFLNEREPEYVVNNSESEKKEKREEPEVVSESMDITQGKLVIGLDITEKRENLRYIASVYNSILGGNPMSKLFQNVREKESLAYTAGSVYLKPKNNIFIKCGIEIDNYEKAVEVIKEQLDDMKKGNFSDENIKNAKTNILSTVKFIPDEQDTEITYYFSQELANTNVDFEEYEGKINDVTKEEIVDFANSINVNTIYFLTNK